MGGAGIGGIRKNLSRWQGIGPGATTASSSNGSNVMYESKASSVTPEGEPDGFVAPLQYTPEVSPEGVTRLKVSAGLDRLSEIHQALLRALSNPLGLLYVQLTDRAADQHHGNNPRRWLAMELELETLLEAIGGATALLYCDGRAQIWIRGALGEQVVLDELGLMYVYPDDPAFRDLLEALDVTEGHAPAMDDRDYIRVQLLADADTEEAQLIEGLGLQPFDA